MGRAITYHVPRDVAFLALVECALSFMVTHLVLTGAIGSDGIPDSAISLAGQGNYVATILACTAVIVTLAMGTQDSSGSLERKRCRSY